MAQKISAKHILIDKANTRIVLITAIATFVVIFSLVASRTLLSQRGYQNRITKAKQTALDQLRTDIQASNTLVASYKAFVGTNQNIIGGNPQGSGAQDGDNAKIVLDALPSQYDFPALVTSLQKILTAQSVKVDSISGTDEQLTQQSSVDSAVPVPVPMPFQFTVNGSYPAIQSLVNALESSIRPFQIQSVQLAGAQNDLTLTVVAQTFYQPGKSLKIGSTVIKWSKKTLFSL